MSKTLAQLREFTRALLSELSAKYWSDAELNTYINDGMRIFCDETDCLDDISTQSGVQYKADYTLPTDYTKIQRVEYIRGNSVYDVTPATLKEQYYGITRNAVSQPFQSNIIGNTLRFDGRLNSAAGATTLSAAITDVAANTLSVASVDDLPRTGRITIDSEIIEYWGISTLALTPLTRGAEGTTAATHSSAATVTLNDIWVYHYKFPATLTESAENELPMQFENAPAHYAAYIGRLKSKDYDLANGQKGIWDEYKMKGKEWAKFKVKRSYRPR